MQQNDDSSQKTVIESVDIKDIAQSISNFMDDVTVRAVRCINKAWFARFVQSSLDVFSYYNKLGNALFKHIDFLESQEKRVSHLAPVPSLHKAVVSEVLPLNMAEGQKQFCAQNEGLDIFSVIVANFGSLQGFIESTCVVMWRETQYHSETNRKRIQSYITTHLLHYNKDFLPLSFVDPNFLSPLKAICDSKNTDLRNKTVAENLSIHQRVGAIETIPSFLATLVFYHLLSNFLLNKKNSKKYWPFANLLQDNDVLTLVVSCSFALGEGEFNDLGRDIAFFILQHPVCSNFSENTILTLFDVLWIESTTTFRRISQITEIFPSLLKAGKLTGTLLVSLAKKCDDQRFIDAIFCDESALQVLDNDLASEIELEILQLLLLAPMEVDDTRIVSWMIYLENKIHQENRKKQVENVFNEMYQRKRMTKSLQLAISESSLAGYFTAYEEEKNKLLVRESGNIAVDNFELSVNKTVSNNASAAPVQNLPIIPAIVSPVSSPKKSGNNFGWAYLFISIVGFSMLFAGIFGGSPEGFPIAFEALAHLLGWEPAIAAQLVMWVGVVLICVGAIILNVMSAARNVNNNFNIDDSPKIRREIMSAVEVAKENYTFVFAPSSSPTILHSTKENEYDARVLTHPVRVGGDPFF